MNIGDSRPDLRVAVVVPVWKADLMEVEWRSWHQVFKVLAKHCIIVIAPRGLALEKLRNSGAHDFRVERFDPKFFSSVSGYNKLMLDRQFYERFADEFDFVLIHQLDAFVFSDELLAWCREPYDYIGAPWLPSFATEFQGLEPTHAGNGGFSIRRIRSFLKVLNLRYVDKFSNLFQLGVTALRRGRRRQALRNLSRAFGIRNSGQDLATHYANVGTCNEDWFWAVIVPQLVAEFRVAPVDIAARFSFECAPEYFFERTGRKLPFGCHGWPKYGREFWAQVIG